MYSWDWGRQSVSFHFNNRLKSQNAHSFTSVKWWWWSSEYTFFSLLNSCTGCFFSTLNHGDLNLLFNIYMSIWMLWCHRSCFGSTEFALSGWDTCAAAINRFYATASCRSKPSEIRYEIQMWAMTVIQVAVQLFTFKAVLNGVHRATHWRNQVCWKSRLVPADVCVLLRPCHSLVVYSYTLKGPSFFSNFPPFSFQSSTVCRNLTNLNTNSIFPKSLVCFNQPHFLF